MQFFFDNFADFGELFGGGKSPSPPVAPPLQQLLFCTVTTSLFAEESCVGVYQNENIHPCPLIQSIATPIYVKDQFDNITFT